MKFDFYSYSRAEEFFSGIGTIKWQFLPKKASGSIILASYEMKSELSEEIILFMKWGPNSDIKGIP